MYKGKINAIFLNSAQQSRVSDLVFALCLDDHNLDYESVNIEPEVQVRVDKMVGSFALIPAEPRH